MSVDGNPAFGAAVLVGGVGRWPEGGRHRVGDGEGVVHAVVDTFLKSSPVVAMVLVTWAQPHESEPRTSGASSFAVAYSEALIENDRVAVAGTKRSGPVSTPSMRRRISCNGSASVSARAVGGECAAVADEQPVVEQLVEPGQRPAHGGPAQVQPAGRGGHAARGEQGVEVDEQVQVWEVED